VVSRGAGVVCRGAGGMVWRCAGGVSRGAGKYNTVMYIFICMYIMYMYMHIGNVVVRGGVEVFRLGGVEAWQLGGVELCRRGGVEAFQSVWGRGVFVGCQRRGVEGCWRVAFEFRRVRVVCRRRGVGVCRRRGVDRCRPCVVECACGVVSRCVPAWWFRSVPAGWFQGVPAAWYERYLGFEDAYLHTLVREVSSSVILNCSGV